jgi:polyisoprenoid-binding protein YceI
VVAAALTADMTQLHSDQGGRDDALATRGIQTSRYPTATFGAVAPVALSAAPATTRGTLTLHGRRAPVTVRLTAARVRGGDLVLAGSAPIAFRAFGIAPPSTAGIVRVRDHGTLEFRLRLRRKG